MRRSDREITDANRINDVIRQCDCCRIAFPAADVPYIVPMNFGFVVANEQRVLYFHSAREGRKIDLISQNKLVGFELDTGHAVTLAEKACNFSFQYQSVIGTGIMEVVEDSAEKRAGLQVIMEQYTQRTDWVFPEKMVAAVAVLKLTIKTLACKSQE